MALTNPILLIEDDMTDADLFCAVVKKLHPEANVDVCYDAQTAFRKLKVHGATYSLVFCEAHLGGMDGIDIKSQLAEQKLSDKTIPFVFICNSINQQEIQEAYKLTVQGIFLKETSRDKYVEQLRIILDYWSMSVTPNTKLPPGGVLTN